MNLPPVLVLTGPTAGGKSALAVEAAERLGAEILSMDSMAVYRRMDVGTAKPTAAQWARVPHHLVDLVEPWESFDTARWLAAAREKAREVAARGRRVLVVGGTPLYLMALRKGLFQGPPADPALRRSLLEEEERRPGTLHERLAGVDPPAAARLHPRDLKRLVRALEVAERTGEALSARQGQFESRCDAWPNRMVGLRLAREEVHARIKERTLAMFEAGLLAEVKAILGAGGFSRQSSQAIGYAQCLAFLRGELPADRLVPSVVAATRRLVRRQQTWFRRMEAIRWVPPLLDDVLAALASGD